MSEAAQPNAPAAEVADSPELPSSTLEWPCVVNLKEALGQPGGLRKRFADSWRVSRAVWQTQPKLLRSYLRWALVGLLVGLLASLYLGSGTSTARATAGTGIILGWSLLWTVLVGVHIGLVRDGEAVRRKRLGLPNGLTLLRILLIPVVCWAILAHPRLLEYGGLVALLIFLVGFTDVLDGLLARWTGWQTILGRYLDHLADLMICSAVALSLFLAGLMPGWLMGLIVFRYTGTGVVSVWSVGRQPNVRIIPTLVGRISTLVVGMTLFLTIAQPLAAPQYKHWMPTIFGIAAAFVGVNIISLVVIMVTGAQFDRSIRQRYGLRFRDRRGVRNRRRAREQPGSADAADQAPGKQA